MIVINCIRCIKCTCTAINDNIMYFIVIVLSDAGYFSVTF